LKLKCDEPLSNFAFSFNLRRYKEGTRSGGGIAWAMMGGLGIGLPPVLNFGLPQNRPLQEKCIKECLAGEKIICLCITEPGAGQGLNLVHLSA
jgi:alkylation response protein AidB-like acyl-CoA dehydrogenase